MLPLFTYGTFQPGERNWEAIQDFVTLAVPTIARFKFPVSLLHVKTKKFDYPLLHENVGVTTRLVKGHLLLWNKEVSATIYQSLDMAEGVESGMFQRQLVMAKKNDRKNIVAYAYLGTPHYVEILRDVATPIKPNANTLRWTGSVT